MNVGGNVGMAVGSGVGVAVGVGVGVAVDVGVRNRGECRKQRRDSRWFSRRRRCSCRRWRRSWDWRRSRRRRRNWSECREQPRSSCWSRRRRLGNCRRRRVSRKRVGGCRNGSRQCRCRALHLVILAGERSEQDGYQTNRQPIVGGLILQQSHFRNYYLLGMCQFTCSSFF